MCQKPTKNRFMAFLKAKCPKCQTAKLFTHSSYNLSNFKKMHEACPVCGEFYEKEIGHFWAAMYVSYMFNVAFLVMAIVAINIFDITWSIPVKTSLILGVLVICSPLNFRYSRVFSLYLISGIKLDKKYIS